MKKIRRIWLIDIILKRLNFDFLENMINYEDIIEKSKEKLDKKVEKKYFKKRL